MVGAKQEFYTHIQQLWKNTAQCLKYSIAGGTGHWLPYPIYIKVPLHKKVMVTARVGTRMQIWIFSTQCSALQNRRIRSYSKSPAVVTVALNTELLIRKADSYVRSSPMQAAKCVSELPSEIGRERVFKHPFLLFQVDWSWNLCV